MTVGRKRQWAAILVACTLLGFSVSLNTAKRGSLVDEAGRPIANAFVYYHYSAGSKLIWPWAHYDGPFLTRTDQNGRFTVPLKAHVRFPFVTLATPVHSFVGTYTPSLHNSCEISFEPAETESYCFKVINKASERVFAIHDLDGDAVARFRTLWLLIYASRAVVQGPEGQRHELVAATRAEYDQFLAEYGNVVFENPSGAWPLAPLTDWTQERIDHRPWSFFLREVPFYGITMEEKLAQIERQTR